MFLIASVQVKNQRASIKKETKKFFKTINMIEED